jgi:hypothetical protein
VPAGLEALVPAACPHPLGDPLDAAAADQVDPTAQHPGAALPPLELLAPRGGFRVGDELPQLAGRVDQLKTRRVGSPRAAALGLEAPVEVPVQQDGLDVVAAGQRGADPPEQLAERQGLAILLEGPRQVRGLRQPDVAQPVGRGRAVELCQREIGRRDSPVGMGDDRRGGLLERLGNGGDTLGVLGIAVDPAAIRPEQLGLRRLSLRGRPVERVDLAAELVAQFSLDPRSGGTASKGGSATRPPSRPAGSRRRRAR